MFEQCSPVVKADIQIYSALTCSPGSIPGAQLAGKKSSWPLLPDRIDIQMGL